MYGSWRWQDCLNCRPNSPDLICALLGLSQLSSVRSWAVVRHYMCQGFFSWCVFLLFVCSFCSFFFFFWPKFPVVWLSPSVLITLRCFCQFRSSFLPVSGNPQSSLWEMFRREENMPLVHLHQHLMSLEGPSQSAFISASMPSSGLILSSHKQDL